MPDLGIYIRQPFNQSEDSMQPCKLNKSSKQDTQPKQAPLQAACNEVKPNNATCPNKHHHCSSSKLRDVDIKLPETYCWIISVVLGHKTG